MKKNHDKNVNIAVLQKMLPDIILLMKKPKVWQSLDVDYFPPRVERVFTRHKGYRIHLHVIHVTKKQCLFHKHRWPAAFLQVAGKYEMGLTYHADEITSQKAHKLPRMAKILVAPGTYYEMTQTDALHYVKPLTNISLSIMITKDLYPEADFRKEVLNKKLKPLSNKRIKEILSRFLVYEMDTTYRYR